MSIPVIALGAPVTQDFAYQIGVDGYGKDAPGSVKLVEQLMM